MSNFAKDHNFAWFADFDQPIMGVWFRKSITWVTFNLRRYVQNIYSNEMTSFPYKILCKKKEEQSFETILSNVQFLSDLDLVRVMLTWAPTQRLLILLIYIMWHFESLPVKAWVWMISSFWPISPERSMWIEFIMLTLFYAKINDVDSC